VRLARVCLHATRLLFVLVLEVHVRKTAATFKFEGGVPIDGNKGGTLTIKETPVTTLLTFRPKFGRKEYTLNIQEVCEIIAYRVTKKGLR
jgi:hypothetical protein